MGKIDQSRWIDLDPRLDRKQVPTRLCTDPKRFEEEIERVFSRTWLKVGRVEQVAQPGDYFVKDIPAPKASVLVTRDGSGKLGAFHNVCTHRCNKLVWESAGNARGLLCKFHAWGFDLGGRLRHVPDAENFYDLDYQALSLTPVAVGVWEGFVFVNLAADPTVGLAEFMGEAGARLQGFPFDKLTAEYGYSALLNCNWKVMLDAFSEGYHVSTVHRRSLPGLTANPFGHPQYARLYRQHRAMGLDGSGSPTRTPMELLAGRFGASLVKGGSGEGCLPADVNPDRSPTFNQDITVFFPNFLVHVLEGNYYTHQFWPVSVNQTLWEARTYFSPPRNFAERFSQEFAHCLHRDAWAEDTGTMEHTQQMLETGAREYMVLQDNEVLIRHAYTVLEEALRAGDDRG
jgi:phenylpropionate dioxygenase-like ring-hydroxylating dioxygenase large terminal subunit